MNVDLVHSGHVMMNVKQHGSDIVTVNNTG